jgi:hypothetical protein
MIKRWALLVLSAALAGAPHLPSPTGQACVRFVTPGTASAGEWIPVLAYRHQGRKGPLELRFDGQPAEFRLLRYAAFGQPDVPELFLTLGVPATAARGPHEIQLYEPAVVPGAPPQRLAASTIVLGP